MITHIDMTETKTLSTAVRPYTGPELRIKPLVLQKGLCLSGGLPPVEEEDAGIDEWGA